MDCGRASNIFHRQPVRPRATTTLKHIAENRAPHCAGQAYPLQPSEIYKNMAIGRPSIFSPELADLICQRICDGQSVREICRDEEMPAMSTVFRWLAEKELFREQYARAKEAQGEFYAEEILDIADDGTNDWVERKGADGQSLGWSLNGEHVQRSRLRVDSRKWLLSKLLPKKYGEKVEIDQTSTVTIRDERSKIEAEVDALLGHTPSKANGNGAVH